MYMMWLRAPMGSVNVAVPSVTTSTALGIAAVVFGTVGLLAYAYIKARARRHARAVSSDLPLTALESSAALDMWAGSTTVESSLPVPTAPAALAPAHGDNSASQPTTPLRDRSEWRVSGTSQSRPLAPVVDFAAMDTGPLHTVAVASREMSDVGASTPEAPVAPTLVDDHRADDAHRAAAAAPPAPVPATTDFQRGLELLALSAGQEQPLRDALSHFRRAQETWTREQAPDQWAMVQNEIGRIYQELPAGDRATNLRTAIMHYQSALEVFDPVMHAMNWAWTQSALGAIYQALPSGSPIANARAAVAYHQRALDVFTRENAPLAWAWNQNNLGAALETMRGGEQGERVGHLRAAVECYEAALQVYSIADHRAHHDVVARNLARVQSELKILE